jgi:hypothetical protein
MHEFCIVCQSHFLWSDSPVWITGNLAIIIVVAPVFSIDKGIFKSFILVVLYHRIFSNLDSVHNLLDVWLNSIPTASFLQKEFATACGKALGAEPTIKLLLDGVEF